MDVSERIRKLRKEHLKMSQTEFGERLGVSRSVINNLERGVLARPEQKTSLLRIMCSEFGVSEAWLIRGEGEMFVEPDTFSLDEFMKERGASELELLAIKAYFELPSETRRDLIDHFKTRISDPVKGAEEEYIKSRSGSAQKTGQSVSSITDDERRATNES